MRVTITMNRSPNVRMLTAATIATWTIILSGSSAQEAEQKCYACGPEAAQWFPNTIAPSCDNFLENDEFTVNCGLEYNYCGITTNFNTNQISRICAKNLTENCGVDEKQNTILCTCNETLCNGIAIGEELKKSFSVVNMETETKPTDSSNENDSNLTSEMSTTPANMMMNDDSNVPPKPIVLQNNGDAVDTNIHVMSQSQSTVLGHDGKTVSQNGAPVDDEEDNTEGSGGQIDNDRKNNNQPTTTVTSTEHITTTANPKNFAVTIHENILLKVFIWTISIKYLFF